jgi:hypothetical protein
MSEFLENVSEEVLGQDGDAPERGRPGTNPAEQPQPGLHPGAGEGAERSEGQAAEQAGGQPEQQDQPEQGLGQPDSH